MNKNNGRILHRLVVFAFATLAVCCVRPALAQSPFIHPAGVVTIADLDRAKAKVAAGEHPWIDSWNALCANPKAQSTYRAAPLTNMFANRQRASADAVAAYLNAIRWYISGDPQYAECAVRICNGWSAKVSVVDGSFEGGLMGIPAYEFAVAGEVLRAYPGWAPDDFARFKNMMENEIYPSCHDFLVRHDGTPITHYWANWDLCNMIAILGIGVLCDDRAKFDEAIEYFKHGKGNGSIEHAIPFVYNGGLAQWQESGRDQEHTQLGVGMMAMFCQIAWNQGLDLFSYDDNRLLKAAEYVARYNLWQPVPYTMYDNEDHVNQYWHSDYNGLGGARGRLQRPIWELLYNHYVVLKGLKSPGLTAMAALYRPEGFEHDDNFGFGTLLYTLDAKKSPYPPSPAPLTPTGLKASAGVGNVVLTWTPCETADGFIVSRATSPEGPFVEIMNYRGTYPVYTDEHVTNGTTYYYRVASRNQAGTSGVSNVASATPVGESAGLPEGWTQLDIGNCAVPGSATHADANGVTIIVSGSGTAGIGVGKSPVDGFSFVYKKLNGDFAFTVRRLSFTGAGASPSRLGIMIRETLDPGAKMAALVTGDLGRREARIGGRSTSGSAASWQYGNGYSGSTTWYRLKRQGDKVTGYQSLDGITWYAAGTPLTVPMNTDVYAGMAVSSDNDKSNKASFDNIVIE
ncbi:MAG: alginate lyase family protein [Capsulimonadaceae bacterium]|nr:alginate lyase family protein [Capsulimonadaceae bacterium]